MSAVHLQPVSPALARAVVAGDLSGVVAAPGWPHADTLDALRPLAESGGEGTFLVVETETGRVVGDCGWFGPPDGSGTVEVGYGLASPSRGRGYGGAAVAALLEWVTAQPGVTHVVAEAEATNTPSRRLLERLGFALDAVEGGRVRYGKRTIRVR